ncbi:MAG TPA: long-chain-acyl-CoA synthetase [Caulobacteraceae bacterium]|nr:long-chain-acyl-CoA synthetase [Caulobacteraceae bacterium]
MDFKARIRRELKFLRGLVRTLIRVASIAPESTRLICDDLEAAIDTWRTRPAISFEERTITYGELDAIANRYAHWAMGQGIRRGHTVALVAPNRIDYLAIWYGLSKVGVATALINNNLTGASLAHCLALSGAAHAIADAETEAALESVNVTLERPMTLWTLGEARGETRDLSQALKSCSALRPDRSMREDLRAKDVALYIYTSGTTGLPKAAKISHMRAQLYMRGFAGATDARASDRIYVALPLYHATGGLCGMGAALLNGGSVALKSRFSASHFWNDVAAEGCTMFVYIGELCRYLTNQPPQAGETSHRLRLAFGNGLRPEVWATLQSRFNVQNVLEFYGSTEGNVSLFNFDGKVGAVGRIPAYLRSRFNVRLVRFDVESNQVVRDLRGYCAETEPGEIGECVGQIRADARSDYSGYVDKAASDSKVLRNVFKAGDAWFATGDLMRQDEDRYFYFVDRIGDTFRWKGENVSTSEVEQALAGMAEVTEVNVYGVKVGDLDGRAGMASLVVTDKFDMKAFAEAVDAALPPYARPVFVRLQPEIATTGTFKHRKVDLVAEGFDPGRIGEPLFVRAGAEGYEPITAALFAEIEAGEVRL